MELGLSDDLLHLTVMELCGVKDGVLTYLLYLLNWLSGIDRLLVTVIN